MVVDGEEGDRLEVEAEDKNQLVMLTGDFIQVDTILGRYKNILYDSFGILLIVAGLCVITLSLFRFMKKRGEK